MANSAVGLLFWHFAFFWLRLNFKRFFGYCFFFAVTLLLSECSGWNDCVCFAARREVSFVVAVIWVVKISRFGGLSGFYLPPLSF
jgi:hypothetical protein